jgi:hypothetical protein
MRVLSVILMGSLATPVFSQAVFSPPEGCTGYVTIQAKDCSVSNHFVCEMDDEGDKRRVDFDEDGFTYAGKTNNESQWIESFYPRSDSFETLMEGAIDPASFSGLIETGVDTYDFITEDRQGGQFRFIGSDRLTGEQTVIDGVTLSRTSYEIRLETAAGEITWASSGAEFVHPEWRIYISGTGTSRVPGEEEVFEDGSPVEFIFPGEPGFFSSQPKFGCGVVMSSFDPRLDALKEMIQ